VERERGGEKTDTDLCPVIHLLDRPPKAEGGGLTRTDMGGGGKRKRTF